MFGSSSKKEFAPALIRVVAFFLLAVFALWLAGFLLRVTPYSFARKGIYAVFLNNGQVYFGSIGLETADRLNLENIYYLKTAKPVLSQDELQNASDASLVKLGNELHGPEDRMEISRSQILFVEKLKADGKVAKAIEQYGSGQK